MPLLSVVIPCYNEKDTIKKILEKVELVKLPQGIEREVIIVDDGSTDGTREVLKQYHTRPNYQILYHSQNKGKGAALRTGFKVARGDFVVIQDADLEYHPQEIPKLLEALLQHKEKIAVYGSRNLTPNPASTPLYKLGVALLTKFFNLLYQQKITDLYTCYKMFPRKALEEITLKENDFNFEAEVTCQLVKNGYQIKEVPISYVPRSFSQGKKIRWHHGLKGFFVILKNRL